MRKIKRNLATFFGIVLAVGVYISGMYLAEPEKTYAKVTVDAVTFYEQYKD